MFCSETQLEPETITLIMPPSSAAVHKTKTADGLITVRFKFVVPVCDFPHRKPSPCFELEDLLGSLETLAPTE